MNEARHSQYAESVTICAGRAHQDVDYTMRASREYTLNSSDISKLLFEKGIGVKFEHQESEREIVLLKSHDIWLPILAYSVEFIREIGIGVIADVLSSYVTLQNRDDVVLHIQTEIEYPSGLRRVFSASGDADGVIRAQINFEKSCLAARNENPLDEPE